MTKSSQFLSVLIVPLFVACDEAPAVSATATSAGQVGVPTSVAAEPRVRLGVLEGDPNQEFHRVTTPFLLPGDRVAVPLQGANAIRIFSLNGEFVQSLGSPGEGPGEFTALGEAWARGDTIEAFDLGKRRITRFLPDQTVESVQFEYVGAAQTVMSGWQAPDRWVAHGVATLGMDGPDVWEVHWFARDGQHLGRVAEVESWHRRMIGGAPAIDPLSPKAFFAVHDSTVYVGHSAESSIKMYQPSGSNSSSITWSPEARPLGETLDRVRDEALARASDAQRGTVRARFDAMRDPSVSTAWGILVDELGYIWVREFDPLKDAQILGGGLGPGPGGSWRIFDPNGTEVGKVQMPDGLEPSQITADYVIGTLEDDLDVQRVQVHRLNRN